MSLEGWGTETLEILPTVPPPNVIRISLCVAVPVQYSYSVFTIDSIENHFFFHNPTVNTETELHAIRNIIKVRFSAAQAEQSLSDESTQQKAMRWVWKQEGTAKPKGR